jgi:hypothetical protein
MTASCSVLTTQEPGNVTGHITGRLTAAAELRRDG